ncbi:porin [Iodobacter arcticus]|uniref:Porin n=1 Tax=Iodobacter arcticus TaxID=590593 RepID=A0ABW2R309_9NEIS
MFKRALIVAAVAAACSAPAFADVSINGSAEMDVFYRTNNTVDGGGKLLEEIAIVVNVDGSDKLDNGAKLNWRLAQKVATDWRYDSFGNREAWIGYSDAKLGEVRFGNQFTNLYLTQDWPYGVKGLGGLFAEPPIQGFANAITYASPNFGGFSFNAGYDLGLGGAKKNGHAGEIVGHFTIGGFSADAGYAATQNATMGGHGNGHGNQLKAPTPAKAAVPAVGATPAVAAVAASAYSEKITFAGARYNFANGLNLSGAWKRQSADEHKQDFALARVGYVFGKQGVSLGLQRVFESKLNGKGQDNKIDNISFQYDYSLSKQTDAFVQIRHNKLEKKGQVAGPFWVNTDGLVNADNSTRILVGTWTAF